MRPAGVPRHSADPNSLKSLVFGTHLQGAALLPSAGTPPPATAPAAPRRTRAPRPSSSARPAAAPRTAPTLRPRTRRRPPPVRGRGPPAGGRPGTILGSCRRAPGRGRRSATARRGGPWPTPTSTRRRRRRCLARRTCRRRRRGAPPRCRRRGSARVEPRQRPALDRAIPTPRQGRNARLQRARRRRRRRWCATAPPLPHAAAVEATLAAGQTRPPSFLDDALPRKPETRRVAPDASGMPSDRRAVGGELGKQHVTHADPTTPAGVPAPYTPYATIDAAPAAAPTHPQMLRRAPHFDVAGDAGHRGRQLANADAKHAIEAALAPASVARVVSRRWRRRRRSRCAPASRLGRRGGRRPGVSEAAAAPVAARRVWATADPGGGRRGARAVDAGRARQRRGGGAAAARRVRVEGRWAR